MSLKNMTWDENVWESLKDAMTYVPVLVRKRALKKIIETSEVNAKARRSNIVEAEDLIRAAKEKVPERVQDVCFETLAQHGINVDR